MVEAKRIQLKNILQRDKNAADLRISLFAAAAHSFKWHSCLRPCPGDFQQFDKEIDIDGLRKVIDDFPELQAENIDGLEERTVDLMLWILSKTNGPAIKSVPKTEVDKVLSKSKCSLQFIKPNLVFEVIHDKSSASERSFSSYSDKFETRYAYHGSKLLNFHSISNYGLHQHLNKTALYGEGIYLSKELHVSLLFSPTGSGWQKSSLGNKLACAAICQYAGSDSDVVIGEEKSEDRRKMGLPEKYILVRNNDCVQVRYLLLYSNNPNALQPKRPQKVKISWIKKHRSLLIAAGYFVLLASIGIFNSRDVHFVKQAVVQKISVVCNVLKTYLIKE